ncbi:septal ring lytic transglycosylase RlpA family protein [Chitiniphilus eburneus]|uniref:Endolytic peptidoglycan transglycosylase RlpA n=1 Tax=Chitiniphilus eburneus TaxID=2571148 RepID=A0A4U0QCR0_9NEIS|nr:septal ring lytic transglycosylase RlpA family protein [Chitiniphilus eburneus]
MKLICLSVCTALLAACSSTPSRTTTPAPQPTPPATTSARPPVLAQQPSNNPCVYVRSSNGAFYKDDGPLDLPPWIDLVPEATPRAEPLHRFANNPYTVLGQSFTPIRDAGDYRAQGIGSWYGRKFHGQKTSSGEVYDMFAMTAASPVLPIPSYARITNVKNGRSVIVRVNDRGPFHKGRVIDLSFVAACRLGYAMQGSSEVVVESLTAGGALPPPTVATVVETPAPASAQALPPPAPVAPVAETRNGVYLQLGAFSSRTNAEAFLTRLSGELPPGSPLVIQTAGAMHRVRLGPYPDRHAAELAARQLADAHDLTAVIGR